MTQQVLSSAGAIKASNSFGNAGYGTALPSSPTDGMEYILVDSVSAPTYYWRMRYNAGSASSRKWEFVGGTPKISYTAAAVSSAAGSGVWSSALGPAFSTPNAGEWLILIGGKDDGNASGSNTDYGVGYGASPASSAQYFNGSNSSQPISKVVRTTDLAAATSLDFYIRDNDSTRRNPWSERHMHITPHRIS